MNRWLTMIGLLLGTGLAIAATGVDVRGWSKGTPAKGTARILGGPQQELPPLTLPGTVAKRIKGKTLLFYFSPACPHCQRVTPEVSALHQRLREHGSSVLAVATSAASPELLQSYQDRFSPAFPVLQDEDGAVSAALGARSVPVAVLVEPAKTKGQFDIVDAWYPYRTGYDLFIEMQLSKDPWAPFKRGHYMGNQACGGCHQQEMEAWVLSHHSIAWSTLERGGHTDDSDCTSCHVTGAGEPTGYNGTPDTAHLVNVGCESCHGPAGPHDGVSTDPGGTCESCHDEKHSINFRLEKGLPLIDHYAGVALDDATFRARVTTLRAGEAPRALLAFDEGDYVGNGACTSCHASQHEQWASSAHGKAMETLQQAGKQEDAQCVSCHATPKVTGPRPTELDQYNTESAVGCESCHGPGSAHVKAGGGKDNIERLGDDCPVCVIEAVCTSCHTKEQDPNWNLETDLKKVGHGGTP